ncbi:MAG: hypothetical protein ABSA23_18550 [Anaerolineales bacterium]|jgi:hypothetical protein
MNFAINNAQLGLSNPFFKGRESQVQAAFRIAKFPWFHIVACGVFEFYLLKFMNVVLKDEGILASLRQVSKATAEIQTNGPPIR